MRTAPPFHPPSPAGPARRRTPRPVLRRRPPLLAIPTLALAALVAAAGWLLVRDQDRLPLRTTVAGIEVSGLTRDEARRAVERGAAARAGAPIAVIAADGSTFGVTGRRLGARPLVTEALELAEEAGPLERVVAHLGIGGRDVPLRFVLARARVARFAAELDESLARSPRNAGLRLTEDGVVTQPAARGLAVNRGALNSRLRRLAPRVAVPVQAVEPEIGTAAAERARLRAERLLDAPRVIALGPARVTIRPDTLRRALRFRASGSKIALSLSPAVLARRLRLTLGGLEREPVEARFVLEGDRVLLHPSREGRALDVEGIARSLVAAPDRRLHRTALRVLRPSLTTAEARALRIREPVSSFTTEYPCCAPRVTNIQRAAEILDGILVRPGATFSLNEALGRRTKARGFVEAPQIFDGRLEDAVGGGVSQVATTLYNAAFFAGLQLLAHSPHQFYISRYPMGREATVSWGGPELVFRNDWPAGILIDVSATDTSITVRFFSSRLGRRVETTTGRPFDYVQPVTREVTSYDRPPGSREQVQDAGGPGFSVVVTRKVFRGDRLRRSERWTVDYDAQDAIVEVGPPA